LSKRIGRNNKPFLMFKFRTMTIDAPNINLNSGTKGAARIGDTADTGDAGTGGHFDTNSAGTNVIETGSSTVIIGG